MTHAPRPPSTLVDTKAAPVLPPLRSRAWVCFCCGASETCAHYPETCACGVERSFQPAEPLPEADPSVAPVPLAECSSGNLIRVSSGDAQVDALLGGGFVRGYVVLVYGPAGSGKSRLVYRWASAVGRVLLVDLEMGPELARATAAASGARLERVHYTTSPENLSGQAGAARATATVLDSLTETGRATLRILGELRDWARSSGGVGFAIAHENSRRRVLGSSRQEYRPDVLLRVSPGSKGRARVAQVKSRFGPKGSAQIPLVRAPRPASPPAEAR